MTKKVYKQKYFSLSQLTIQTRKFYLRIQLLLKDKMVLRMKNCDILGESLKNLTFKGVGSRKTNTEGEIA